MAEEKAYTNTNKFGNVFGKMITTPVGRAVFCHLTEPNRKYQPEKYGMHILFDKKDEKVKAGLNKLIAACNELLANGSARKGIIYPAIRDGDDPAVSRYQGFAGSWYIKASSKKQVTVCDSKKTDVPAGVVLPGHKVIVCVSPILFDSGFAYKLNLVQFVEDDGVRYYGGPDPKSLLDMIEDEAPAAATLEEAAKIVSGLAPVVKGAKAQALDML